MKFLNFIWYCLKCMFLLLPAAFGHSHGLTWKDILVGFATLITILAIILLILFATGVIKIKK